MEIFCITSCLHSQILGFFQLYNLQSEECLYVGENVTRIESIWDKTYSTTFETGVYEDLKFRHIYKLFWDSLRYIFL